MKIKTFEVAGLYSAIHGMRNPLNSWSKSDSGFERIANDCVSKGYMTKDSRLYKAMINYQVKIDD